MTYYYKICGIQIRCEIPFSLRVTEESVPFLCPALEPDIVFRFEPVASLELPTSAGAWMVNSCYHTHGMGYDVYHCPVRGQTPFARVRYRDKHPDLLLCEYVSGREDCLSYSRNVIDLMGLERLLLHYDALLLHSALVRWNDRAVLFTAPSGTGKSTQANLWERYENADVLNGDRAALRHHGNIWLACGLPYAGSSGIYRNESAPIAAIVYLRQAPQNRISRITSTEAMRLIYPELTIHRWDAGFVNKAVDLFLDLISQVPVYILECLPDEGAVQVLKEQLVKGDKL